MLLMLSLACTTPDDPRSTKTRAVPLLPSRPPPRRPGGRLLVCESKTTVQHVETFTPNVIEPSFGIDRILTAMCDLAAISPQPRAPRALPSFDARLPHARSDDWIPPTLSRHGGRAEQPPNANPF